MKSVLVIASGEAWQQTAIAALRQAIEADGGSIGITHAAAFDILCPLTLDLPKDLEFSGQAIFSACRDLDGLRDRVRELGYDVSPGSHWLPIVQTAKGALFGEAITHGEAISHGEAITTVSDGYQQPLHLSDRLRQPLYALGQRLMRELAAPPAVYLLQFGLTPDGVMFDRLWPFPAAPAIGSLGVQVPNLYECHWRCLSNQAIVDLAIAGTAEYKMILSGASESG